MRTLKEDKGIEFYTDDDGRIKAKTITDKLKSSKSKNKLSDLEVVDGIRNLAPKEKETAVAVKKILKSKGKLSDVSQEFNTDPKPDLTFKANGDVVVTPDNGKASYKIPEEDVESAIVENTEFRRGYDARVGGNPIIITESNSWLNGYGAASKDLKSLKERRMPKSEITESKKKKPVKEAVVKWTNDIGEATAYELNQQVEKTLREYGYSFGGNDSERPVCAPKKYYLQDRNFEGHTTYLLSVKGEYYDEIIIQICDSRVCGMANYTIRSPEGVLWMGQTPKEFVEDIRDMTSSYSEM